MKHTPILACIVALVLSSFVTLTPSARADEGMWLFNAAPVDRIEQEYGVRLDDEWLNHVMQSAVRFGRGGSASFVSGDGLLLTNHHVARGQLVRLSTPERDLIADGFIARTLEEELPCDGLSVMSLREIVDVTDRIREVERAAGSASEAEEARRRLIAQIEAESLDETGLHSEVITLYAGGLYHLYRFERFTDIRMVFAPERAIAAFGGDVDNFEFPRWCLDMALLRVYKDGEPYRPKHFLRVEPRGVKDGDPVFVAGHPGRTQRNLTVDHLRYLRDHDYPNRMHFIHTREVQLRVFAEADPMQARQAPRELAGIQNGRKGLGGKLVAMQDPRIFAEKVAQQSELIEAIRAMDDDHGALQAFEDIRQAMRTLPSYARRHSIIEGGPLGRSELFGHARRIVRLVEERAKPSGDRLSEFRDAAMPGVLENLNSVTVIPRELEINRIESALLFAADVLGGDDPTVQTMLGGVSAAERARELVNGTTMFDASDRVRMLNGGREAVWNSDDPLIQLAMAIDHEARRLRERYENEVEAVQRSAYAKIATARFAAFGQEQYPDATSSLRLSTGRVKAYEQEGQPVEAFATFAGLYERHAQRGPNEPFDLPQHWLDAKDRLDLSTPFNFVSTNDIIGGNSGSPVVNAEGRLVGLIFDGNRYSFVWDVLYTDPNSRGVSVDIRAMLEPLRIVYRADHLVNEMVTGRRPR